LKKSPTGPAFTKGPLKNKSAITSNNKEFIIDNSVNRYKREKMSDIHFVFESQPKDRNRDNRIHVQVFTILSRSCEHEQSESRFTISLSAGQRANFVNDLPKTAAKFKIYLESATACDRLRG
jgi:hypothetical protein